MTKQEAGRVPDTTQDEWLSAALDGELDAAAFERIIVACECDPQLRSRWASYHVVGDALRSCEVAACHSGALVERVTVALAAEPALLVPQARRGVVRRSWVAPAFAIAAAVAVLSVVALPLLKGEPQLPVQQALAPAPATEPRPTGSGPAATPALTARAYAPYLEAHGEFSTHAGLVAATPYMRASFAVEEVR